MQIAAEIHSVLRDVTRSKPIFNSTRLLLLTLLLLTPKGLFCTRFLSSDGVKKALHNNDDDKKMKSDAFAIETIMMMFCIVRYL